ncbi:MAG: 5'/3'-nucleotidase SurE [Acidobacteria bacterium]|nr:5'/3'-nucleotidase SurE [Acidobacteriota bacterium]
MTANLPRILVTNDDGIDSEGLLTLATALSTLGQVTTVAPIDEQSACSHSVSLFRPLRYEQTGPERYAVHGTPADSVILALNHILSARPNLIVSGINAGANLGLNVFYSGTVSAAAEGIFHGIPSFAISICSKKNLQFEPVASFAAQLAAQILREGLPSGVMLNVNVPPGWSHGVCLTQRSHRHARRLVIEKATASDRNSYWIREQIEETEIPPDSDRAAVRNGHISITPLVFEGLDYSAPDWLKRWVQSLPSSHSVTGK